MSVDKTAVIAQAKAALWDYRQAQRRMRDKWADGDDAVKRDLWRNLHDCEEKADAALSAIAAWEAGRCSERPSK